MFDKLIKIEEFKFKSRSKNPPQNRTNSLMSFGNSLLYNTVSSKIYRTELDNRIGFLHSNNYRGNNLNLDIADIFKPIIVDRVIISCIRLKILRPSEFNLSKGKIYLSKRAMAKFIERYEKRLRDTISIKGQVFSYSYLITRELVRLRNFLMNIEDYREFSLE